MARTPSQYAVWMLEHLGPAAKPFAMTGGLATLGFVLFGIQFARKRWAIAVLAVLAASLVGYVFQYASIGGQVSFWVPAVVALMPATPVLAGRREALIMIAGTVRSRGRKLCAQ